MGIALFSQLSLDLLLDPKNSALPGCGGVEAAPDFLQGWAASRCAGLDLASSCGRLWIPTWSSASRCSGFTFQLRQAPQSHARLSTSPCTVPDQLPPSSRCAELSIQLCQSRIQLCQAPHPCAGFMPSSASSCAEHSGPAGFRIQLFWIVPGRSGRMRQHVWNYFGCMSDFPTKKDWERQRRSAAGDCK